MGEHVGRRETAPVRMSFLLAALLAMFVAGGQAVAGTGPDTSGEGGQF
ncbi:MAG: hypothetical protein IMX00_09890 [Limnochordales bacterium]|nr:hypothetical protein [Limnochordales bacterium]